MSEVLWLLATLGVSGLVGHAAFRLAGPKHGIGQAQLGERAIVKLAFGIMALTWWGIVLAEARAFGLVALLVPPAAIGGFLLAIRRGRRTVPDPGERWRLGAVLTTAIVAVIAAQHFFPAFDVRVEARDPGVYYLAGVSLAKTGGIDYTDPTILELSAAQQTYFFPPVGRVGAMESNRFLGYYVQDIAAGRVVPQALPVLPVWVAIGHQIGGQLGSELATPVLAFFAVVGMYLLAYRMVGSVWPAAVVAIMLSLSFVQAWFARYVAAEVPAQLFALFGLYGLLMHRRHGGTFFGVLGGLGLGLMWMAKAELLLMGLPLALLLLADGFSGRAWRKRSFWIVLALAAFHTLWHAIGYIWPYYFDLLRQVGVSPREFFIVALVGGAGYGLLFTLLAFLGKRAGDTTEWLRADWRIWVIRSSVAAALAVSAAVGYWLRPTWYPGGAEGWWEAYNVVELTWAVSPSLFVMAVLGAMVLILTPKPRAGWLEVGGVLIFATVLLLWDKQINPFVPWSYRRWLPMVIPACYIGAAFLTARIGRLAATGLIRALPTSAARFAPGVAGAVAAGLLLPALSYHLDHREPYASHVEMPGITTILEELDAVIEPGALVLFEPRTLRGTVRFEAALALSLDRRVLRFMVPDVDYELLQPLIWNEAARGRPPVYLLTTGYLNGFLRPHAEPVYAFTFETERLLEEATADRAERGEAVHGPPQRIELLRIQAYLYRLDPFGTLRPLQRELDVGLWDHLYLQGMYMDAAEVDADGRTYRWTTSRAGFYLPGMGADARELVVDADPDTLPGYDDPTITLSLDGRLLGQVKTTEGWHQYPFAIPDDWAPDPQSPPYVELEISPTYRPIDVVPGSRDRRILGIKINRISWSGTNDDDER